MRIILIILFILFAGPPFVYYCVKFGTVAFFKAKQFIEKEND